MTTITTPELPADILGKPWARELKPIANACVSLAINNDTDLQRAVNLLAVVKETWNQGEAHRKADKQPYLDASKAVDERFRPPLDWLKEREDAIKRAIRDYQDGVERRRRDEQHRLEQEAAAERARLLEMASEEPDQEDAEDLRTQAIMVTAPIASTAPKVSGLGGRTTWKAEVADMKAFVAFLVAHPDSTYWELLKVDAVALNKLASAFKDKLVIPGVLVKEDRGITASTKTILNKE